MTLVLLIHISEGVSYPSLLGAPFPHLVGLSGHITLQPPTLQLAFEEGGCSLSGNRSLGGEVTHET